MSAGSKPFRRIAATVTAFSFLLTQFPAPLGAQADSAPPDAAQRVTIEQCQNLSDPEVRSQIRSLTETALNRELGVVDYAALVDTHWRAVKLSERLDQEVDEAIRIVRADTSMLDRAYSTISRETAERTAISVAERAYGSEGFRAALADLAQAVGTDFGARIENASGRVSGPVIDCVRTALQSRYGGAVAQVFARETEGNMSVTSASGGAAKIGTGDLLLESAGTISGIVLIVTRRIIARMVTTIGQRVAGLVASRIVSSFTGLIGLALIARDVYEATEGVFPLISERMKSDEAKDLIKAELTNSIQADLSQQVGAIAEETTDRIYSFWQEFKQKYNVLLGLSERHQEFSEFLKNRTVEQLGRLGRLVGFLLSHEDEASVVRRTRDGSLSRAILDLNDTGIALAIEMKSLERALAWAELAGPRLDKAVEYGLPQLIAPNEITQSELSRLLEFDNRASARRIAQLERSARDALLALPTATVKDLARRLSEGELAALATYQSRLDAPAASRIMRAVAEDTNAMRSLSRQSIQGAILNSRDQLSAVTMLLRDNTALSFTNIAQDLSAVRSGDVNYRIFVERYWVALLIAMFFGLLLLILLRRALFGRPATVVIRTEGGGKS